MRETLDADDGAGAGNAGRLAVVWLDMREDLWSMSLSLAVN